MPRRGRAAASRALGAIAAALPGDQRARRRAGSARRTRRATASGARARAVTSVACVPIAGCQSSARAATTARWRGPSPRRARSMNAPCFPRSPRASPRAPGRAIARTIPGNPAPAPRSATARPRGRSERSRPASESAMCVDPRAGSRDVVGAELAPASDSENVASAPGAVESHSARTSSSSRASGRPLDPTTGSRVTCSGDGRRAGAARSIRRSRPCGPSVGTCDGPMRGHVHAREPDRGLTGPSRMPGAWARSWAHCRGLAAPRRPPLRGWRVARGRSLASARGHGARRPQSAGVHVKTPGGRAWRARALFGRASDDEAPVRLLAFAVRLDRRRVSQVLVDDPRSTRSSDRARRRGRCGSPRRRLVSLALERLARRAR